MRARHLLAFVATTVFAAAGVAQLESGDRGFAAVAGTGTYEVSGIAVDVSAKTADDARYGGWRLAQRKAWAQLAKRLGGSGGGVGDGTLDQLVSGIVVENEQIGPNRYIARLGVLFNRARASSLLGVVDYAAQSAPMLVMPIEMAGGVARAFEGRTDWQAAWARFRPGESPIDYVRPGGTGPDSLLLNYGQAARRGRGQWRAILDQYGASDVLIPTVRLFRQWPGGPVIGVFQARHGPDNDLIGGFTLRVSSADGVPQLMDAGVKRIDALYARALSNGALNRDPGLIPPPKPAAAATDEVGDLIEDVDPTTAASTPGTTFTLQYDSPTASAVANTESLVRGLSGVRSAGTTSLALGGVSLMRVVFDGDIPALKAALTARGYQVTGEGPTLRIRRSLLPPDLPPDGPTAG